MSLLNGPTVPGRCFKATNVVCSHVCTCDVFWCHPPPPTIDFSHLTAWEVRLVCLALSGVQWYIPSHREVQQPPSPPFSFELRPWPPSSQDMKWPSQWDFFPFFVGSRWPREPHGHFVDRSTSTVFCVLGGLAYIMRYGVAWNVTVAVNRNLLSFSQHRSNVSTALPSS